MARELDGDIPMSYQLSKAPGGLVQLAFYISIKSGVGADADPSWLLVDYLVRHLQQARWYFVDSS